MSQTLPLPVARAPATTHPAAGRVLQRKCACSREAGPSGECAECRRKRLQRKSTGTNAGANGALALSPAVQHVLQTPGQALDQVTRSEMERHFGHDFGRVQVHTGAQAAASARAVNALAYTVGQHVVFDDRRYAPATREGKRLLAHELAHVVQQHDARFSPGDLTLAGSRWERRSLSSARGNEASNGSRKRSGWKRSISHCVGR